MNTKTLIISVLFSLCFCPGFSQVHINNNLELNGESDPLTAMNSVIEEASKTEVDLKNSESIITSFPEFVRTSEYSDVNDFIYSNMEFPEEARVSGRSGLVKVRFDVYKNGSIGNIDFLESPDISFNKEVLRLLDVMPNWKPALSGEHTVKSRYQLNINFSLR